MRLSFLGATGMVTGSSYLLETGEQKYLIDCGMFQGSKAITSLNNRPFLFDPASVDGVLLTHSHIDHSGLLPKLCKAGFKGPIYCTKVTAELCGIMLPDSAHIQQFDAEIANRKGQRAGKKPVEPLYTVDDACLCLQQFSSVWYNKELELSPELKVKFRDAGHILGSSMLEIWVTENNQTSKIVFSGDLGQPNQPIIKDPTIIEAADYVVVESTYGNRSHAPEDPVELLGQYVRETVKKGGNVIIPAFAVGRTQTLLYHLHNLLEAGKIPDIPVIIDSPLAISATSVFTRNIQEYDQEAFQMMFEMHDNPLTLPQLRVTKTAEESRELNKLDQPAIIISASGMADAGRILHHLKHNLWRPESTVLFAGYQAQGSLGRRLVEGAKKVKIMGEEISVKATIHNMEGFSAHADQRQLLEWLEHIKEKPANVFIVHGEPEMSEPFARLLNEKFQWATCVPKFGDTAVINGRQCRMIAGEVEMYEPELLQLREYMAEVEHELVGYRQRLEAMIVGKTLKWPDLMRRMDKIRTFVRKNLNGQ
ncbi:MAG TPA: MBL fold metallo-hydrolase [Patescibacteria group bacterium]|nr:MBL fold metallo-hydrolase [Patescibacteria group bacterium]